MSWWAQIPVLASAAAVLFLPGLIAAFLVRLRGFTALATAMPLSAALLTAAALVNAVIPFRWGLLAWLISCVLLLGIAMTIRWASDRWSPHRGEVSRATGSSRWRSIAPFLTALLAAVVAAPRLMFAFGRPDHISQTFDNIYHLNAARLVLDEGFIAPTRQMLPGFYPDLWHVVVATTSHLSGASIPIAVNAVSIVLGAVAWPIACIWLVRTIVGPRVDATVAAGVLSVGMAAFPLLMLDFGVLYPNVLSISLLPSAIATVVLISGLGRAEGPPAVVRWALLIAVAPSLALAHPSTLIAWVIIAFWIGLIGFITWSRRARQTQVPVRRRRQFGTSLAVLAVGALLLLIYARPTRELAYWPPSATVADALRQLFTGGLVWRPESLPVVAVTLAGLLTILVAPLMRRHWWLIASLVTLSTIYVICLTWPQGTIRYMTTGTWYQDVYRIAALFPAVLVPLGAIGISGLSMLLARLLQSRTHKALVAAPSFAGVAAALVVLVLTQTGSALVAETANTQRMYRQDATSPLINDDERALIERLPNHVAPHEVIVGSPWTGTSLSYALVGRRALVPHIFQALTPDMTTIVTALNRAAQDPTVCDALNATHTKWVLDFGTQEIHNGDHAYPGLTDLGPEAVELEDRQGDAALYRIIACR